MTMLLGLSTTLKRLHETQSGFAVDSGPGRARLLTHRRPGVVSPLPASEQTKAAPVPSGYCLWLYEVQGRLPAARPLREPGRGPGPLAPPTPSSHAGGGQGREIPVNIKHVTVGHVGPRGSCGNGRRRIDGGVLTFSHVSRVKSAVQARRRLSTTLFASSRLAVRAPGSLR
jgi:hypothetical protein